MFVVVVVFSKSPFIAILGINARPFLIGLPYQDGYPSTRPSRRFYMVLRDYPAAGFTVATGLGSLCSVVVIALLRINRLPGTTSCCLQETKKVKLSSQSTDEF